MSLIKRIIEKVFHLEPEYCQNCETLKTILAQEEADKHRILACIVEPRLSVGSQPPTDYEALKPKHTPWAITRQRLEAQDRERAAQSQVEREILDKKAKEIASLEKELDVEAAS